MEADRVLTLRELNRATLARQMLLDREPLPVSDAVKRLVGLQAPVPNPPYIGLWTRLRDFRREDLTHLLEQREVVRATLMRSTLHLILPGTTCSCALPCSRRLPARCAPSPAGG